MLARLDGDRLRLEVAQTEANLRKLERDYKRQLELSEKGLVAKGTAENAKFDLDALRASYDRARLELSYTEIRAPIDGVVSARHIKVGNTIAPNAPTFHVTNLDPLVAYVHVPEKEFRKLAPQQTADVRGRRARQRTLHRHRSRASVPTVDPKTGTFRARVEVQGPDPPPQARHVRPRQHRLRAARGRAATAAHRDRRRRRHAVRVRRRTATRPSSGRSTPASPATAGWKWSTGLKGDERVVVVGQAGLKTGTAVKVVDAAAPAGSPPPAQAKSK